MTIWSAVEALAAALRMWLQTEIQEIPFKHKQKLSFPIKVVKDQKREAVEPPALEAFTALGYFSSPLPQ